MIRRILETRLSEDLLSARRKVVCVMGPRQVGKTTLMKKLFAQLSGRKEFLNADFEDDRRLLRPHRGTLNSLAAHLDFLFVDEAQNLEETGRTLKVLHDEFPKLRVLASGSSSFDLRQKTGEPLTGRQIVHEMFPIALSELDPTAVTLPQKLENGMVFGLYPEALQIQTPSEKRTYLRQLAADYLLKDVFHQVDINRARMSDLLRMLALQIGSEVSLNELSRSVQIDVKTVSRYLSLLEQTYVIVRLGGFSRNLRKEVAKAQKVFFLDLGVRNALLQAFQPLALRQDTGPLWENFMVIERLKHNRYRGDAANSYFWRTYDQQEIDYVEERAGALSAYEFKYTTSRSSKAPKAWSAAYPGSTFTIVTPSTVRGFLLDNRH